PTSAGDPTRVQQPFLGFAPLPHLQPSPRLQQPTASMREQQRQETLCSLGDGTRACDDPSQGGAREGISHPLRPPLQPQPSPPRSQLPSQQQQQPPSHPRSAARERQTPPPVLYPPEDERVWFREQSANALEPLSMDQPQVALSVPMCKDVDLQEE
ncbi:hypothetical protein Vafri_15654, partial [Volvox africanus]